MPTGNRHHCLCLDLIHHLEVCFSVCVSLCVCVCQKLIKTAHHSCSADACLSKEERACQRLIAVRYFCTHINPRARIWSRFSVSFPLLVSSQARKAYKKNLFCLFCLFLQTLISFTQLNHHPFLFSKIYCPHTHTHSYSAEDLSAFKQKLHHMQKLTHMDVHKNTVHACVTRLLHSHNPKLLGPLCCC